MSEEPSIQQEFPSVSASDPTDRVGNRTSPFEHPEIIKQFESLKVHRPEITPEKTMAELGEAATNENLIRVQEVSESKDVDPLGVPEEFGLPEEFDDYETYEDILKEAPVTQPADVTPPHPKTESAHDIFYEKQRGIFSLEEKHKKLSDITSNAASSLRPYIDSLEPSDLIGDGEEKLVYHYGPDHVAAFMSSNELKREDVKIKFYIQKLAALLAPECVPSVKLAATSPNVLILDKIEGLPVIRRSDEDSSYRARALTRQKLESVGFSIDISPQNFVLNDDGGAVYVDSPHLTYRSRMQEVIDQLPPPEKRKAEAYLGQIEILEDSLAQQALNAKNHEADNSSETRRSLS